MDLGSSMPAHITPVHVAQPNICANSGKSAHCEGDLTLFFRTYFSPSSRMRAADLEVISIKVAFTLSFLTGIMRQASFDHYTTHIYSNMGVDWSIITKISDRTFLNVGTILARQLFFYDGIFSLKWK